MEETTIKFENMPAAVAFLIKQVAELNRKFDALTEASPSNAPEWMDIDQLRAYLPSRPAVIAEKKSEASNAQIAKLSDEKRELHRKAYPERYRLSSRAELVHWWIPNRRYPNLSITTQFHGEEFKNYKSPARPNTTTLGDSCCSNRSQGVHEMETSATIISFLGSPQIDQLPTIVRLLTLLSLLGTATPMWQHPGANVAQGGIRLPL